MLSTQSISTVSTVDSALSLSHELEIPVELTSVATYEYLGFTTSRAVSFWRLWTAMPSSARAPDGPNDFVSIPLHHIRYAQGDAFGQTEGWRETMDDWDICTWLTDLILTPEFDEIRLTRSGRDWVLLAIHLRYEGLIAAQRVSRHRVSERQRKKQRVGSSSEEPDEALGGSDLQVRGGISDQSRAQRPQHTPGSTTLWRGGIKIQMDEFLNDRVSEKLLSQAPSDFRGGIGAMCYLTPQREVAILYAKFKKHIADIHSVALLRVDVPNSLIESLKPVLLRSNETQEVETFKRIVYESRRGLRFPKDLSHLQNKPLFTAHICKSHNKAIAKLPSWEAIGDDNIMKVEVSHWREGVGGPARYETKIVPAIQYVFNGYESLDALNDKGEWSLDINFDAKIL